MKKISILMFFLNIINITKSQAFPYVYDSTNNIKLEIVSERKIKHIFGPKLGICMAGISNYGFFQGYSFRIQYGLMGLFRITDLIGIETEICYTSMGTNDMSINVPFAIKKINDDEENVILTEVKDTINKNKDKVIFKKGQEIKYRYITLPLSLCLIFNTHKFSYITNYFTLGFQIGILIDAEVVVHANRSILIEKDEDIDWKWADPEEAIETKDYNKEINPLDIGLVLGYMFETKMGFLLGIKYYEGLKKIYKRDKNLYNRQRKNLAIELFFAYNILNLFNL